MSKKSTSTPSVPAASPEELAALQAQANLLAQIQPLLTNYLNQQQGVSGQLEAMATGGLPEMPGMAQLQKILDLATGAAGKPLELAGQGADLYAQATKRLSDVLAGRGPESIGLERDIARERALLEETLRRNLGAGYGGSTPGLQALGDFAERALIARENARNQLLGQAMGLVGAGTTAMQAPYQTFSQMAGTAGSAYGQLLGGREQSLRELMGRYSMLQGSGETLRAALAAQFAPINAWANLVQQYQRPRLAQAGMTTRESGIDPSLAFTLAPQLSDRRLKHNIRRIGTHPLGIGIYAFEYLWGEPGIGVMADEVLRVKPQAVSVIAGYLAVDYSQL